MYVVMGAIVGGAAGLTACLLAARLLERYGDEAPIGEGGSRLVVALVALAVALLGGYAGWRVGSWATILSTVVVTAICFAVSLIDLRVRRIPNILVCALAIWGLAQTLLLQRPAFSDALLGALVGGGTFALLFVLGRGAMGAGDVKFVAASGLLLGVPMILYGMLWGILFGGIAALLLLASRRAGRKDPMAYGPYLALGVWVAWIWQHVLV